MSGGAVWDDLVAGNERFATGAPRHPHQDAARRAELTSGQAPRAVVLSCSDSRVPPELAFDQGLGDLFVVRNAGQVASAQVLGSLEYGVEVLGAPLLVVLAHESCGAVAAAAAQADPDAPALPPLIRDMIAPIAAAVAATGRGDDDGTAPRRDPAAVGAAHLRGTIAAILDGSELIGEAVAAGRLGVVGATYRLHDGRVIPDHLIGLPQASDS